MGLSRPVGLQVAELDARTIEACRRGERAALDTVFRAHAPALERLLGRIVGNSGDVSDLLQDTLEAAMRGFAAYRGQAPVGSWLARIAVRAAFRYLKNPERRRRAPLELVADEPARHAPDVDEAVGDREMLRRIYAHMRALSPKTRIAFVLHVIEGRPIEEVAALMGATETATKSRVFLARRKLLRKAGRDPVLRERWLPGGQT